VPECVSKGGPTANAAAGFKATSIAAINKTRKRSPPWCSCSFSDSASSMPENINSPPKTESGVVLSIAYPLSPKPIPKMTKDQAD